MSEKIPVHPNGKPAPKAALSLGIVSGGFLFVSGAVAFHPETGEIVGDTVEEQTRQTLNNVQAVLAERGLGFGDVVQARAYLAEAQRDFAAFDATYREFFAEPFPARTTIGVTLAKDGLLVEVDVVAALSA